MFKLPFMKNKKKAFSLIDVIFAVLFVFIMLVLGLKIIFTSNQIEDSTVLTENITNLIANHIEIYNNDASLFDTELAFYDEDFSETLDDTEENRNKIRYRLSINVVELKDNLHLLKFEFYDVKEDEEIFRYEYKAYVH